MQSGALHSVKNSPIKYHVHSKFNYATFSREFQPYRNWNSAVFLLFEWISFTLTFLNSFEEEKKMEIPQRRGAAAFQRNM